MDNVVFSHSGPYGVWR